MKHRIHPLDGDWDGVVTYDHATRQFRRYTDREHWEPIAPALYPVLLLCERINEATP